MESKLQSLSGNLSVKLSVSFVMKSVMTGVMCALGAVLMNAQSNFLSLCFFTNLSAKSAIDFQVSKKHMRFKKFVARLCMCEGKTQPPGGVHRNRL